MEFFLPSGKLVGNSLFLAVETALSATRSSSPPRAAQLIGLLMKKLRIGIIDLLSRSAGKNMYVRTMRANLSSIMPQVLAVWCEEEGHEVFLGHYNGYENMVDELPDDLDVVFVSAFTTSAQLGYALSNMYRTRGAVTVLGGPHARSYPEDARKYFDYVCGFTDKALLSDLLHDCEPHRPHGVHLEASQQPSDLPGVRARWKFIERLLQEAPWVKIVPMIGSLGCPYTCSFCVDSIVPYQPLDFDQIKEDLRFLLTKYKRPVVGWHDPNFGVRFDDYLDTIEDAIPPDSIDFIAESTLSLLKEDNVRRLKKNGFKAILPGIESWFDMGYKTRTGKTQGMEKVERVAEQVNMVLRYLPYFQGNFVLGLDCDEGPEPFELTKEFLDRSPGTFPAFSILTAFGRSAPLNLEYQKEGRMIPAPFHFLNNNGATNVRPKNYAWGEFYDLMIDMHQHAFSKRMMMRRFAATRGLVPRAMNLIRGATFEGLGKIKYFRDMRRRLDEDRQFRDFVEQETDEVPPVFIHQIKQDLGPMWEWLPEQAVMHDPHAYLQSTLTTDIDVATA